MSRIDKQIEGSLVAIVTPMRDDGSLDLDAFRKLIEWHVESGTAAIVAVGTTGESPTVDVDEHIELIASAVDCCAGRIPVIAGTGANSTKEAIHLTREAARAGAAATLQVAPYYNRPGQEGLYRHFAEVADQGGLPVILYNVPGRTVADISNDTVVRLAKLPGIIGMKDATGDIARGSELLARLPEEFAVYSGNDDSALGLMCMGARGVISVVANVAPVEMARMCQARLGGDPAAALKLHRQLLPLHFGLFVEANPIPVKWVLARMGRMGPAIRLPMTPLDERHHDRIVAALKSAGVKV